jgi:dethiobiotin synthetase
MVGFGLEQPYILSMFTNKLHKAAYFIAGTDTDAGKTLITGLLARELKQRGRTVITQKWVHSGTQVSAQYLPEDLATHEQLIQGLSEGQTKQIVCPNVKQRCPYRFTLPASAHLAAEAENEHIDPEYIKACFRHLSANHDQVLVEGIGGILLPYSRQATLLELVKDLNLPVILVVANRLGAINHALLTLEALKSRGLSCEGMIWTCPTAGGDKKILEDNPKIVETLSQVPVWASLAYGDKLN